MSPGDRPRNDVENRAAPGGPGCVRTGKAPAGAAPSHRAPVGRGRPKTSARAVRSGKARRAFAGRHSSIARCRDGGGIEAALTVAAARAGSAIRSVQRAGHAAIVGSEAGVAGVSVPPLPLHLRQHRPPHRCRPFHRRPEPNQSGPRRRRQGGRPLTPARWTRSASAAGHGMLMPSGAPHAWPDARTADDASFDGRKPRLCGHWLSGHIDPLRRDQGCSRKPCLTLATASA